MKSLFLKSLQGAKRCGNLNKLIIFFNGWSLDENIVKHVKSSNYDVIMFYDYNNLEIPVNILTECSSYEEVNIIAWSFGVWACGCVINQFNNIKNVIAINGTLTPIDNNFGIPEKIFKMTLANLSEKTYPRFFQNMFDNPAELDKMPERTVQNQKEELIQIQKLSCKKTCKQNKNLFTKIFVGISDKIIPAKNQLNFWDENKIIKKKYGHYIPFKTWDEIIND